MPEPEPSVVDALNTLRDALTNPHLWTGSEMQFAALAVVETALADLRLKERTLTDYFEDASRRAEDAEARAVAAEAERNTLRGDHAAALAYIAQLERRLARAVLAGEEPT